MDSATKFELVMSSPAAGPRASARARHAATACALLAIWTSTGLISLFAPDMITGAEHEHLPIAAMTAWLFAAVGTAFVLMASGMGAREDAPGSIWWSYATGVGAVWLFVMLAGLFAPEMVTGSDPTRIPLAAMLGPIAGSLVTAFASIWVLGTRRTG